MTERQVSEEFKDVPMAEYKGMQLVGRIAVEAFSKHFDELTATDSKDLSSDLSADSDN